MSEKEVRYAKDGEEIRLSEIGGEVTFRVKNEEGKWPSYIEAQVANGSHMMLRGMTAEVHLELGTDGNCHVVYDTDSHGLSFPNIYDREKPMLLKSLIAYPGVYLEMVEAAEPSEEDPIYSVVSEAAQDFEVNGC